MNHQPRGWMSAAGAALLALILGITQAVAQDNSKLLRRSDSGERIRILDAVYGQDERICRALDAVSRSCDRRESCEVTADDRLCGNPYANVRKELFVGYDCGDGRRSITVYEGEVARIYCRTASVAEVVEVVEDPVPVDLLQEPPPNAQRGALYIAVAEYGARDRICDAAPTLAYSCDGVERCDVPVDNDLCGDPARGTPKSLYLAYWCDGELSERDYREGQTVSLRCR
ncbi:MAG: hypothetical protein AAF736_20205 [Pseudomonadota bacterium]